MVLNIGTNNLDNDMGMLTPTDTEQSRAAHSRSWTTAQKQANVPLNAVRLLSPAMTALSSVAAAAVCAL